MKRTLLVGLLSVAAWGQTPYGLGGSSLVCADVDRDGYGNGPLAQLVTTSSDAVTSTGTPVTIHLVSVTGLSANMQVRFDSANGTTTLGNNMEFVVPSAVDGVAKTITAVFAAKHSSGVVVSAGTPAVLATNPSTGAGCIGPDADDWDATVQTYTQGKTKYGTGAKFIAKLGRNYVLYSTDNNNTAGVMAAPTHYWAISPTGNDGTCARAADPDTAAGSPCLTFAHVRLTVVAGDVVLFRAGNHARIDMAGGSANLPIVLMAWPGEQPTLDGSSGGGTARFNALDTSYFSVDGLRTINAACFGGGTTRGAHLSSTFHDIALRHMETYNCEWGISAFNGLSNFTIEYNVLHDDCSPSGSCQHGMYIGSDELASSNVTVRRNIAYDNDYNGLTFNGRVTNYLLEENISYNNLISGLTLEMGVSNSTIRSNLSFNNNKAFNFFNYLGDCTGLGGSDDICPYDQTGNVIENNTFVTTNFQRDGTGNSGASTISIVNCSTSETGSLGSNIYRNNILVDYGLNNHNQPIVVFNGAPDSGTGGCATTIWDTNTSNYLATSTFQNNLYYQSDGSNGTGLLGYGAGSGFGFAPFTPAQMAATFTGITISGNINANPGFASFSNSFWNSISQFDLRLLATSQALRAGTSTGQPPYDVFGYSFVDNTPSIGAIERHLYNQGWTTFGTAAAFTAAVAPPDGSPSSQLQAAITSTSATTATVGNGALYFPNNTVSIDSEVMCVTGVSGNTLTFGNNAACGGTTSTNGRGWQGTTAATHGASAAVSANTLANASGSFAVKTPWSTLYPAELKAWADGALRETTTSKQLIVWGGGHSDYSGNEVYAFNFNTPSQSFLRLTNPSQFSFTDAANCPVELEDGTPNVTHSGGTLTYMPLSDTMLKNGGGVACGNGLHYYDTHSFSFANSSWSDLNGPGQAADCTNNYGTGFTACSNTLGHQIDPFNTFSGSGFSGANSWDPVTQTAFIYWETNGGQSSFDQFFPSVSAKGQHVLRSGFSLPALGTGGTGQGGSRVMMAGRRTIAVFDYAGATTLAADIVSTSATTFLTNTSFGFVQNDPALIDNELICISTVSAPPAPFTVTAGTGCQGTATGNGRGWNGTTAATHTNTTAVSNYPRAWTYDISGFKSLVPLPPAQSPGAITASPSNLGFVWPDTSCYALMMTPSPGLDYIPTLDRIIGYPAGVGGNTYYLMDPNTWTCTSGTFAGGPPTSPVQPYILGHMRYSATTGVVPLVNDTGPNGIAVLSLTPSDPTGGVAITPATLGPQWTVNQSISQVFTGTGFAGPITWSETGTMPPGCTFTVGTATLACSPITSATGSPFSFSITGTDGTNNVTNNYSVTVNLAPAITLCGGFANCPATIQGSAYSQALTETGGTGTITYALTAGSLAGSGLSLNTTTGVISGTAGTPATYSFTVTPTDSNGVSGSGSALSIAVTSNVQVGGSVHGGKHVMAGHAVTH